MNHSGTLRVSRFNQIAEFRVSLCERVHDKRRLSQCQLALPSPYTERLRFSLEVVKSRDFRARHCVNRVHRDGSASC